MCEVRMFQSYHLSWSWYRYRCLSQNPPQSRSCISIILSVSLSVFTLLSDTEGSACSEIDMQRTATGSYCALGVYLSPSCISVMCNCTYSILTSSQFHILFQLSVHQNLSTLPSLISPPPSSPPSSFPFLTYLLCLCLVLVELQQLLFIKLLIQEYGEK